MSKEVNKEDNTVAEVGDDISHEATYSKPDLFFVSDKDPKMHYRFINTKAARSRQKINQMGYVKSKLDHSPVGDGVVLMEIPKAKAEAYKKYHIDINEKRIAAVQDPRSVHPEYDFDAGKHVGVRRSGKPST